MPLTSVSADTSGLVCITAGPARRAPLFCVHGRAGGIDNFRLLADRLGSEQPFYALRARGLDGRQSPHDTIEEAAAAYISAIETICRDGPFILGGYSGGGVIAYEMAQQFLRSRRLVDLIIMFDSVEPREMCRPISTRERLLLLPKVHPQILMEWPLNRFRDLQFALYKSKLTVSTETAQDAVGEAYLRAQSIYFPEPYSGDLYLVRARRARAYHLRAGRTLGWEKLVSGTIEVCDIDCTHLTMFEEPAVSRVAEALVAKIDLIRA
jgi:thioesterase domain-containing protein